MESRGRRLRNANVLSNRYNPPAVNGHKQRGFTNWRCGPPLPGLVVAAIILAIVASAPTGRALAQDQRIYAGVTGLASQLTASADKRVDTRAPDTLVPEPRRGRLLHDRDSGKLTAYGPGLLAGYRHPVVDNTLYLSVELDVAFDNEAVESQFPGIGESAGRNQLGESWPDHWSYDSDRNYGVSVRLGVAAGPLRAWDASVYGLVGMRGTNGTFSTRFNGCLSPSPCSSAVDTPNFVSGTDSRNLDFQGTTFGIGLERRVRQRVAVRIELRHTEYDDEGWVTPFDDVRVTVPAEVGAKQSGLMVSLARTF